MLPAGGLGTSPTVDLSLLRAHLVARLKDLTEPDPRRVRTIHESWSDRLPALVDFLQRELPTATTGPQALSMGKLILDLVVPNYDAPEELVERLEAERLLRSFNWENYDVARYAAENQLTRLSEQLRPERTLLAKTLLRLTGREATRWLLTIETERSTGAFDGWRTSRELLRELLSGVRQLFNHDNDELYFPYDERTLKRLSRMGVARAFTEEGEVRLYEVDPTMRDLIEETLSDDAWRAAVRAALGDETQRIVSGGAGTRVRATSELSRIVTHEVRNALVPVRHHATALLATEQGERDRVEKVLRGVNRVLHFVDELVTISEAVTTDRMKTSLGAFLEEAIGPLDGAERLIIAFAEQNLELPREPLARALRNVVQNALQLTSPPTAVDLTASIRDGQLVLAVDDGGTGVPPELRERVFEDGFTTREGGSGYGLAMTRRILTELGGSVRCEPSPLGGARFVLAIPLTEPTS